MSNARHGRVSRTAAKKKRGRGGAEVDEVMSAGEMDEMEDMEDEEEQEKLTQKKQEAIVRAVFAKHKQLIAEKRCKDLAAAHFDKMMFYLQLDMNLLIYGVGSKRELLQDFMQNHVQQSYSQVNIRGYHSGLMPKVILNDIIDYIREDIDHNKTKN